MPKPIKKDIIAEPPKEQSGNGTPTTGIIPVTIPTLTKTLKKKLDVKLIPKIFEKKFLDSRLNLIDHKTNTIYKRIKTKYRKDLTTLAEYLTEEYDTTSINFFTHRITCSNIENKKWKHEQLIKQMKNKGKQL